MYLHVDINLLTLTTWGFQDPVSDAMTTVLQRLLSELPQLFYKAKTLQQILLDVDTDLVMVLLL